MAMPWSRAKQIARALRGHGEFPQGYTGSRTIEQLTALFDACFRIQEQASEAAGHHIPLVVENVAGAQRWVGRAAWHFGSFYLWGDVPALMPSTLTFQKWNPDGTNHGQGSWFAIADSKNRGARKVPGMNFHDHEKGLPGRSFQTAAVLTTGALVEGMKGVDGKSFIRDKSKDPRPSHGNSPTRKAASAAIAKIPFALSNYLAKVFKPENGSPLFSGPASVSESPAEFNSFGATEPLSSGHSARRSTDNALALSPGPVSSRPITRR